MLNVLMITPEVDENHDSRGFIHQWVKVLSGKVGKLNVISMRKGAINLPPNVFIHPFRRESAGWRSKIMSIIGFYKIIFNILQREEIDIVFVHMTSAFVVVAAPLCRLYRKPIILWHEHGHVAPISKLAFYFVDKIVSASESGFGNFKPGHPKKLVVGHGIDTDFFVPDLSLRPREAGEVISVKLLSVSRISPSKDYETVIRALPAVIKNIKKPVRYTIIGRPFFNTPRDDIYFDELKRLTRDLSLENAVVFADAVPNKDIVARYQRCDIFINPSLTGSLDKTGLEAMACGKPVVSCNKSYCSVFGNYGSELFFEPKNNGDLANKLIELINKPNKHWETMGADLRKEVVAHHNLEQLMDKLVIVFNKEIGQNVE